MALAITVSKVELTAMIYMHKNVKISNSLDDAKERKSQIFT